MLHKFRIALAAIFLAAGAVAAVDSASALPADGGGKQIPLGDGVLALWRTMMLNKLRIALAATLMALAAVSAPDSVSAANVDSDLMGDESQDPDGFPWDDTPWEWP
jgi:hypothetical protein